MSWLEVAGSSLGTISRWGARRVLHSLHSGLIVNSGKHIIGNKVLGVFDHVDLDQSTGFYKKTTTL
ncbi:MAG TPA: hypothetical protein EYP91_03925 [Gammaproteobacteria bacterium]|nr:hypothetical protein [Gammaproteobacteria bacterium]